MKILQLCNKFPFPANDGGNIATTSLTEGFMHLGHEVTILAMSTIKHPADLSTIPLYFRNKVDIFSVEVSADINYLLATLNLLFSRRPYNAVRFISTRYRRELIQLLKNKSFDIIQLEGLYLSFYISIIRKYSNARIVMRAHNIEYEIWQRSVDLQENVFKRFYLSILTKRIQHMEHRFINKYDMLLPITERDAKLYAEMGNTKPVHVTPFGINTSALNPDSSHIEIPSIFYIGALDWAPNQDGLIWFLNKVWPLLQDKISDLSFYVAGRNCTEALKNQFNQRNIVFLGEIDDAYAYINSKEVMIVPLFSGSGMRVKIIEGMALGKVIITTNIGAEGIPCTHRKNILIANTPLEFLKQIEYIIDNKALFNEISKNAISFVRENFDNFTITESLTKFYNNNLS